MSEAKRHTMSGSDAAEDDDMPAQGASDEMSEWQPIETAPKDGTRFLAIAPQVDGPFIVKWWRSRFGLEGFGCDGWHGSFTAGISHWMPLPSVEAGAMK